MLPGGATAALATARIGVIGIGAMGLPMALRLQEQGFAVTVHDIDPQRHALALQSGCALAPNPAALAAQCELLIVAVVDGAQTRSVLLGDALGDSATAALPPGATVMLCPTIAPQDTEAIAAALQARGLQVLDAPMSGGPLRARDGSMSLMVAGADAVFARWQPLLQCLASRLYRVGRRPGDGARTKLVNNLLAAVNLAGAAEAMALAARLGLDASTTLAVLEQSSGQSWIGSDRLRRALAGDTEVLARLALLAKDAALALTMARAAGAPAALGQVAGDCFAAAARAGLADADDSALLRFLSQPGAPGRPPAAESAP
jgi:3-hydroxyisobutyrate dehydrogenase